MSNEKLGFTSSVDEVEAEGSDPPSQLFSVLRPWQDSIVLTFLKSWLYIQVGFEDSPQKINIFGQKIARRSFKNSRGPPKVPEPSP